MMFRYKIIIEYDGSEKAGWQRQNNAPSIQQYLEDAIAAFSSEEVTVWGSGRTDAGVHAKGQVAHFDLEKEYNPKIVKNAINHFVKPFKIVVISCSLVEQSFHARFSATKRYYQYIIHNRETISPFLANYAWNIRENLDTDKMQEAANLFTGTHDFTSFRTVHCQALSPIKTVDEIKLEIANDNLIQLNFKARSFLHHMVRNLVGAIVKVGQNKLSPQKIKEIIELKDRRAAPATAPAHGLYFMRVDYD